MNRTLKSKLYCYLTAVKSLRYIDVLQDMVDSYNGTYHSGKISSSMSKKFKFSELKQMYKEYVVRWSGYRSEFDS